ncbi:hypothetical protein BOTCAL_0254g00120 [Botryotinia calthae]|uniref:Uncharacterized protein n=1 Tax=Botryotinia calthae TaxID=38488 RepID=A0A4Y8CZ79_9HELO|nr:hypothetical protein BOTCAL_0254g00120 [Botryotinia calthae]
MSMSELLNLKLPHGPAKMRYDAETAKLKLEKEAAEKKAEQEKWKEEQSERPENKGRRERSPSSPRLSTGIERERERKYEKPLPERFRQQRGHNSLPAEDFHSAYLDRQRTEKLEQDRKEKKNIERRRREEEAKQNRWDEQERRGREEEDEICRGKIDPTDRAWKVRNEEDHKRIAEEIERAKRRESKARIATPERVHREKGGHTKPRENGEDAVRQEKSGKTHIYSSRSERKERERDRDVRNRSTSRDRDHNRDHVRVGRAPTDRNTGGGARHRNDVEYGNSSFYIRKSVPKPEVDRRGDERMNRARSTERRHTDRDTTRHSSPIALGPRHIGHTDEAVRGYTPHEDPRTSIYHPDSRAVPSQVDRSGYRRPAPGDPDYYNPRHGMYRG